MTWFITVVFYSLASGQPYVDPIIPPVATVNYGQCVTIARITAANIATYPLNEKWLVTCIQAENAETVIDFVAAFGGQKV